MSDRDLTSLDRRGFLQTGAIATASAVTMANGSQAAPPPASKPTLLRRPLGKTGIDVTMLELGTWKSPGLQRLLRVAYDSGVRTYDTADCYGSEPAFKLWFKAAPEVRKEIFLVTKDHPRSPRELITRIDKRLAAMGTDYVDLFLIHGIGPGGYGEGSLEWPKSQEFKETIETLKKSGKAKFVGFSCHDALRPQYLQAAAEGGFVDVIMLQFTPWLDKDSDLNRAIDACHKRGIGLISMKQVAGHQDLAAVAKHAPNLIAKGLTPYQALLHAIWTDER
ncbi:MAG TPA: aldo/keto reductase, partial [Isosphaeraceae bacterium]|nr:aldo/keto reductase [Isosphaeraceae bacterium]